MPVIPHTPGAVFLSYAREDAEDARRLADVLRADVGPALRRPVTPGPA